MLKSKEGSRHQESPLQLASNFVLLLKEAETRLDTNLSQDLNSLLEKASVTALFKKDIEGLLSEFLSDKYRVSNIGFKFLLDRFGINLPNSQYGIFDPSQSRSVEEKELEREKRSLNEILVPEVKQAHLNKVRRWEEELRVRYGDGK
jgi:hypothetical protein